MSRPTAAYRRHRKTPWRFRIVAGSLLLSMAGLGTVAALIETPSHPPDHPVATDLGPAPQPIGSGGTVSWPGSPTHTARPTLRALLPAAGLTSPVASVTRSTVLPGTTALASRSQTPGSTVSRGVQPGRSTVRTPVRTSGSAGGGLSTGSSAPVTDPTTPAPESSSASVPPSASGTPSGPASSAPASEPAAQPSWLCFPVLRVCIPLAGYSRRPR